MWESITLVVDKRTQLDERTDHDLLFVLDTLQVQRDGKKFVNSVWCTLKIIKSLEQWNNAERVADSVLHRASLHDKESNYPPPSMHAIDFRRHSPCILLQKQHSENVRSLLAL